MSRVIFIFFTVVVGFHMCKATLFIQTSATEKFLSPVTSFPARSKIECASTCLRKMVNSSCTACAHNESSHTCVCGKKEYVPQQETNSTAKLHVANYCEKNAGNIFFLTKFLLVFVKSFSRALHRTEIRCLLSSTYSVTDYFIECLCVGLSRHTHTFRYACKGYESA